ncbi:uncharacterized protein LOC130458966 [Monodelphis domestica]|uniref:uncharacterized protein LOC130458966 n=1 Tax=Monodelphis domestica TaxID=13616 RepID=UPI0024E268F5|nr:uncharacterized protein LOC130458966 [Monodelphis domestica]
MPSDFRFEHPPSEKSGALEVEISPLPLSPQSNPKATNLTPAHGQRSPGSGSSGDSSFPIKGGKVVGASLLSPSTSLMHPHYLLLPDSLGPGARALFFVHGAQRFPSFPAPRARPDGSKGPLALGWRQSARRSGAEQAAAAAAAAAEAAAPPSLPACQPQPTPSPTPRYPPPPPAPSLPLSRSPPPPPPPPSLAVTLGDSALATFAAAPSSSHTRPV